MIRLEEAKELLLSQIELELCRIYEAGCKAPEKLRECYDHMSELPPSNFIFKWYRKYVDKVQIRYLAKRYAYILQITKMTSPQAILSGLMARMHLMN